MNTNQKNDQGNKQSGSGSRSGSQGGTQEQHADAGRPGHKHDDNRQSGGGNKQSDKPSGGKTGKT